LPDGNPSGLRNKSIRVFEILASQSNQVVCREKLIYEVWGHPHVTEDSLNKCISEIRAVLNDRDRSVLKTIPRCGYTLISDPTNGSGEKKELSPGERDMLPTIAILTFRSQSQTPRIDYSGEVISSNIIEVISKTHVLNVISRFSSNEYSGSQNTVEKIGAALNADYVLSGIYEIDKNVTVGFELIEVRSRRVLFADTFAVKKKGLLQGHYDLYQSVARNIVSTIIGNEVNNFALQPLELLPLYSKVIYAVTCMHSASHQVFEYAGELFREILRYHPSPSVMAYLSQWHLMRMNRTDGLNLGVNGKFKDDSFRFAEQALERHPLHAHANAIIGCLEARQNNNMAKALEHHNTAMTSNPNHALNHCFMASANTYFDAAENKKMALHHAKIATRLSPVDPQLYLFKTVEATANFFAGNFYEARSLAEESHELNSSHTSNLRTLISIVIELEDWDAVDKYRTYLNQLDPEFTIERYRKYGPGSQSSICERIAGNLLRAGIPAH